VAIRSWRGHRRRLPAALWLGVAVGVLLTAGFAARGGQGAADTRRGPIPPVAAAGSVLVPNLRGMPVGLAQGRLCSMGLPSVAQGIGPRPRMAAGGVLITRPPAGARARPGRVVRVLAAGGPDGRYIVSGCP
jgi:hypothetical protein